MQIICFFFYVTLCVASAARLRVNASLVPQVVQNLLPVVPLRAGAPASAPAAAVNPASPILANEPRYMDDYDAASQALEAVMVGLPKEVEVPQQQNIVYVGEPLPQDQPLPEDLQNRIKGAQYGAHLRRGAGDAKQMVSDHVIRSNAAKVLKTQTRREHLQQAKAAAARRAQTTASQRRIIKVRRVQNGVSQQRSAQYPPTGAMAPPVAPTYLPPPPPVAPAAPVAPTALPVAPTAPVTPGSPAAAPVAPTVVTASGTVVAMPPAATTVPPATSVAPEAPPPPTSIAAAAVPPETSIAPAAIPPATSVAPIPDANSWRMQMESKLHQGLSSEIRILSVLMKNQGQTHKQLIQFKNVLTALGTKYTNQVHISQMQQQRIDTLEAQLAGMTKQVNNLNAQFTAYKQNYGQKWQSSQTSIDHLYKSTADALGAMSAVHNEVQQQLGSLHVPPGTAPVAPVAAATTEAVATTAAPAQLPPGWEQSVNSTGRTYYVDHNTKSTHWEAPTAPVAPTATPPATGTTAVPPPPSPLPPTGTQLPLGNASGTINVTSYAGSTTVSPGGVQSAAVTGAPGPDPALTPPPPTAFEASATFPPPPPSGTGAVGADAWMYEQTPTVLPEEVQAGTMPHGLPLAPPPEITPPFGTHGHVSMPPPPPLIPLPVHPYDETPLSVPAYEAKLGTSTEDIIRRTPAPGTSVEAAMAWNPPADPVGPGAAVMMTAHHWTCSCDDASGQQAALSVRHDDPGLKMAGEFTLDDSGPDEALAKAQTQDTALRKKTSRTMRNK